MWASLDPRAKKFIQLILVCTGVASLGSAVVIAEPWISNRFAQNCAACHAPGRVNKEPVGRRCTLSCQGCHVNPQGGGLRNTYGKWNSQRWLRSFNVDKLRDKGTPAPLSKQLYAKRVKWLGDGKALPKKVLMRPAPHREIRGTHPPLKYYDKNSWDDWHTNVESEEQFLATIPLEDPYRLERELSIYAGADVRYFYGSYKLEGTVDQEQEFDGIMALDVGLRVRPLKWHKLSFVVESRIQDNANTYFLESLDTQSGYLRSAYVMVDDLDYNSFVQFGNQRPLFGLYNPNHESLAQQISGFGGRPTFRTLSIGAAPNIPFLILNYIMPSSAHGVSNDAQVGNDDSGYAVALGGRWVTLGLSGKLSYWSTTRELSGSDRKWEMYSLTGGAAIGPAILNAEILRVEREREADGGADAGNVTTLEAKLRVFRENYFTAGYSLSNVLSPRGSFIANMADSSLPNGLAPGEASEMSLGFKSFPVAGIELELIYSQREEKVKASSTTEKINQAQIQIHAFF